MATSGQLPQTAVSIMTSHVTRDCCLCGEWMEEKQLLAIEVKRIHQKIRRRNLNTQLEDFWACWRCRRKCVLCQAFVVRPQAEAFGGKCAVCTK